MPDLIEGALSRAALWGGNPPLGDTKGLASLAQYAAERDRSNALMEAANITARAHLEGARAAAGAHERGLTGAAGIHEAGAAARAGEQAETSLANAATARYGHEAGSEGAQEYNLASAAKLRGEEAATMAKAANTAYVSGAPKVFGLKSMTEATPAQLQMYEAHKGNLGNLQNAWEGHQWWETHGTPENIGGFLGYARSNGAQITPESEAIFRAQAGVRSPEIRSHFGPAMEEYVKNQPIQVNPATPEATYAQ